MNDYTLGFDVSRWQGDIDFDVAANNDINFNTIRATVGDYYTDTKFVEFWNASKAAGIYTSVYHVVKPSISVDAQMEHLFAALNGRETDFPIVLDVELTDGKSKAVITNVVRGCVEYITDVTQVAPIIYTNAYFWDANVNTSPFWGELDLWVAHYPYRSWWEGLIEWVKDIWLKDSSNPRIPRDWNDWTFLQFTSQAPGNRYGATSSKIDLDFFNGSKLDLDEYVGDEGGGDGDLEERVADLEYAINALLPKIDNLTTISATHVIAGAGGNGEKGRATPGGGERFMLRNGIRVESMGLERQDCLLCKTIINEHIEVCWVRNSKLQEI